MYYLSFSFIFAIALILFILKCMVIFCVYALEGMQKAAFIIVAALCLFALLFLSSQCAANLFISSIHCTT